ncbi:MAG: dephospho-CoA kinase [Rhizobiales bacterium]|nr:dephospho-CoA kinase [Hyphomicrobiales bacterium]
MKVIGLTGSIAMGKSETARMFAEAGVPVFDSDAMVHRLYATDGAAVAPLRQAFPQAVRNGAVDRETLSAILAREPERFAELEAIVHPLLRRAEEQFLADHRARGTPIVLLDIPLLFETQRENEVDVIVVVSAPAAIQRARALARPGMTAEKLATILARQMPDAEKRKRADFIVDSSQGLDHARAEVRHILQSLAADA